METLLLGPDDVAASADMAAVIDAVEAAFGADATGDVQMPAKSYIDLPQHDGDFRSMPAYIDRTDEEGWEAAGVKWVNSHPSNPDDHDLPTVMGTMIYSDPETALPLAILDGTTLTRLRTGAAAAVATRHLAREDATTLGLVGAGIQAYSQLEAIAQVRDIEQVVVADVDRDAIAALIERYGDDFAIHEGPIVEAASCDIVSTTTPVRDPIVDAVGSRTHVNAMGADAAGKHEIADDVLADAKIVIDDHEQCTHSGEINVPWSEGTLDADDIHAEIGAVVAGQKPGREDGDGVTVFDSTGLAIQDVAASHVVYEHAREQDIGTDFPLVGTDT
ncbi:ornithine cyclodeaminase family protein [Salinibaculum rarum]|uniref:ornithine cyclodeaminase family protein n=1 Tax=Salinibaculum rarum TaxID=3058903 RepID=UPI00265EC649|nr:ornithine cyclodeaminase family protein [Salinibaculum sp. KK48]